MVKRQQLNPKGLNTRVRNGHVMMAQVVSIEGGTRHIFLSGQCPRDEAGSTVGKGDMRAQIIHVSECIKLGLEAAGATMADISKTTTYVTSMEEYLKHGDLRAQYFSNPICTSTTVEVRRLAHPDFMVEIEVQAIV
jgi:enamine deaminase RidA (YjgF/YER057c/UK114 family)